MHALTASAVARFMQCSGYLTLPWAKDKPGKAALRGTEGHEWIEHVLTSLTGQSRQGTEWPQCIDVNAIRDYIGGNVFHCEQAMVYIPPNDTAEFITNKGRDYPKPNGGVVFGTADLIIERSDGIEVIDYKTGQDIGPPLESWQMRTLGLMAARAYMQKTVTVNVMYIRPNGDVELDERGGVLSVYDLQRTAEEIRTRLNAPAEFVPSVDACRWCPGKKFCLVGVGK